MISNENIHLIFQKIGCDVLENSFLGKGEASIVLKVKTKNGTYALKTALYPERKKKILQEAEIRKYFINEGLNFIPSPRYSDELFFPNGAVIYDYVEGKKPNFNDHETIKQFALIVGKIHAIDFEIINDGSSIIENLYTSLEQIIHKITNTYPHLMNDSILAAFEYALNEYTQMINRERDKFTIGIKARLHGDLSDNFIIDSSNKIWLLDWENSEYGDVSDELCWFLFVNKISKKNIEIFFQEYKKNFNPAKKINFIDIYPLYFAITPVYNICFGISQLDMNIKQKLEPERKLRDLVISAKNWKQFFSSKTSSLIIEGIDSLTQKIS